VIDPLKDYFARLRGTWDGTPRASSWLSTMLGVVPSDYSAAVGQRWVISAVARALEPGCKVDYVLVLEGAQGVGKSTALARLCPSRDLFFDDDLPIGDKDAAQAIRGKWIVELGELAALSRHDLSVIKSFVTRAVDTYRQSFGRTARDFPRRSVFAATTNEAEYLKDPTGNRRWWPARVAETHPIELWLIEQDRDQLWAEALALYEQGAPRFLETAELAHAARTEQAAREQGDPWEEHIAAWLAERLAAAAGEHDPARCKCVRCVGVTVAAVLGGALGLAKDKQSRGEENRCGTVLRGLGWEKGPRARQEGTRVYPWFPPSSPAKDGPSDGPTDGTA
jgi:predicted P-loop ATPase